MLFEASMYSTTQAARLELQLTDGEELVRAVKGRGGYLSAGDRRVLFGLGVHDRVDRLTVRWPSGRTQTWERLARRVRRMAIRASRPAPKRPKSPRKLAGNPSRPGNLSPSFRRLLVGTRFRA